MAKRCYYQTLEVDRTASDGDMAELGGDMDDDILTVDWQALARLPAAERAKRATELQETANDVKKELARISVTAIKELNDDDANRMRTFAQ